MSNRNLQNKSGWGTGKANLITCLQGQVGVARKQNLVPQFRIFQQPFNHRPQPLQRPQWQHHPLRAQSLWVRVNMKQVQLKPRSPVHTSLPQSSIWKEIWGQEKKKNLDTSESFSAKMGTKADSRRNGADLSTIRPGSYFAKCRVKARRNILFFSYKTRLAAGLCAEQKINIHCWDLFAYLML